jgi:intracellular sulfur oxidation DsrE/DsrF family protein
MKKLILILSILFFDATFLGAQPNYQVVFDLTSKDTVDHKLAIRWMNEVLKAEPTAKVEAVFYGQSLDMVVKNKSIVAEAISKLAENKNASFKVCKIAMQAHNIDMSKLITGVQTVPDGIYEIINKQREGWGYIKVSH